MAKIFALCFQGGVPFRILDNYYFTLPDNLLTNKCLYLLIKMWLFNS